MGNYKSKFRQIMACIIVTLGIFGLGNVLGWSSPALSDLLHEPHGHFVNISKEDQSWIGSSATLGAFAACPVAGMSIEKLGRKRTMVFYSIPFALGWIIIGFSNNVEFMCVGRFISGFCGGAFSLSVPTYISEVSESHIRGMLMNAFQLMLVLGILCTYIIGTFVSWKALALLSSFVPLIFLTLSILIPETPHYLIAQEKHYEAQNALCWFRGTSVPDKVEDELSSVRTSVEESRQHTITIHDLLKPNILKPLAISLTLMTLEQASAFNIVIFYCVDIFATAGSSLNSHTSAIIVAAVQVLATGISIFLVDKAGRRLLLLFSELVMGISFFALGAFFYVKHANNEVAPIALGWLPLVSVIVFIVAFSIGIGPLSWTIMGEILHPNVKGACSAIAVALVWFLAFVVTKIYFTLDEVVGTHTTFWIFSTVSIIGTGIVYFVVPETKGKTLDEIQLLFTSSPRKFPGNMDLQVDQPPQPQDVKRGVDNFSFQNVDPPLKL